MNMPTALALTSALFLCAGSATAGDIDDITKAVTAFAAGADGRDAKAVDGVTDGDFRVVFSVGDGKPAVLSKEAYLGMIKDGKVGGSPRVVRINEVHARDRFASVTATMVRADASFDGLYTLVRTASGWKLLQESVVMTPKATK